MTVALEELRAVDLFEGLEDAQLARWAAAAEDRWLEPGEALLERDKPSIAFNLLLTGRLIGYLMVDGREERDHEHVAPTWLGAIMALTGEPARVSIRAAERSHVATLQADDFRRLLFDAPAAFQTVMRTFRPVYTRFEAAESQREKLAALGQMSAGLAHELNNPAAAAKRTAAVLADALEVLEDVVGQFVESGLERADAERLVHLQRDALARRQAAEQRSALDASDAEDAMGALLAERGVERAWELAEPLAAAGLDAEWLEDVARSGKSAFPAAVQWIAASLSTRSLADDLRDSTDRISSLVKAIKAYTYMDQTSLQEIDVHDGLEATIVMLGHKLKHTSITLERRYAPDLPRVCVYGSELNQVWTNLLDNAIDALGEQGTITIATAPWHGTGVEVQISDDGPGIPADVQRRVFEPFYTTKAVGSGTGLGLDTSRRIIHDRHQGDLLLRSRPGETSFTVRLPRAPRQT